MLRIGISMGTFLATAYPSLAEPDVIQGGSLRGSVGTQSQNQSVISVCGAPFTTPFSVPSSLQYGYLDDQNRGSPEQQKQYEDICNWPPVKPEGCGGFAQFEVATCEDAHGCPLWRVFDKINSKACGYSWSPPTTIEGKSQKKYFEDVAVCTHQYSNDGCPGEKKSGPTSPGQSGGFLLKCLVPYGHAFALGTTQSAQCIDENDNKYTLPATSNLQVNFPSPKDLVDCQYCEIHKNEDGTYPSVTTCAGDAKPVNPCS
jgi:hypothetical protein